MGNQCSFTETNSIESSANPLPTPPEFQFSEVKIKLEEHPTEHPIAPEKQFIHCDYCQSRCIFKCPLCPKTFSTLQALGGHQNAHKKDKLPQKRPSVQEQVGENDNGKGKKKLCCNTGHHPYSRSHPDYKGNPKTSKVHVGNGNPDYSQDHQNCSNQHIIYAPKPLRAVRLNDRQVVTRPINQGNYQPSYSLVLNPNNQSISYDEPSFGRSPHATPPPPPPPPPPPRSPGYWPPNWDPALNIHGIPAQSSGPGHQEVRFPRPVMLPAQKLYQTQPKPVFPPGFGERPQYGPTSAHTTNNFLVNLNYHKHAADVNNNNVGVEQPNAWNLDLTLRL